MRAGMDDAKRRGFSALAALEWVEYLSWPECLEQAGPAWRRALLRRYAFEEPSSNWQGALRARFEGDSFPVGPPRGSAWSRNAIYPPPLLSLGPYPSENSPTKLAPAALHASISYNPWVVPSALQPVRRLTPSLVWTLKISATAVYNGKFRGFLELSLDEPREYSVAETKATLQAMADQLEAQLEQPGMPAEQVPVRQGWADAMRRAADSIDGARSAHRAEILETFMSEPGVLTFVEPAILPDDLPHEWLGVFFAFAFERSGLLSAREARKVHSHATTVLEHWQARHYPRHELSRAAASDVIGRVARMRRLLSRKSLFSYLEKSVQGVERDRRNR